MDPANTPEQKASAIPTVVLAHDDEPGPPTQLSSTKDGCVEEVHLASRQPDSPAHKVWAQHNPPTPEPSASGDDKDVYLDVSEVEAIMSKPDHKITVRILRRILSIMMVILYKTDTEIANKRKMKSLWDRRPADWPHSLPFKDPNNGVKLQNGKHGQKPVHKELLQMYQFLKMKYQREVKIMTTNGPSPDMLSAIKDENSMSSLPSVVPSPVMSPPSTPAAVLVNFPNSPSPAPATPMTSDPGTPVPILPKLEEPMVVAIPQANCYGASDEIRQDSPLENRNDVPKEIHYTVPAGMPQVTVTPVNEESAPAPSPEDGRLHHVLESQYQRLVDHFSQVQDLVNAYNPDAAAEFEKMGKELECLLEETRANPHHFSLIFNDVGHKVESFLSKTQLMHAAYVMNPLFSKECQSLAEEIRKRTAAGLSAPQQQPMTIGFVVDATPTPQMLVERQSKAMNIKPPPQGSDPASVQGTTDVDCGMLRRLLSVRQFEESESTSDDTKHKGAHTITKADLAQSLSAIEGDQSRDVDQTNLKAINTGEDECDKEQMLLDVLSMEDDYLPSSDADAAIISIHAQSPFPDNLADAAVVVPVDEYNRMTLMSPTSNPAMSPAPSPATPQTIMLQAGSPVIPLVSSLGSPPPAPVMGMPMDRPVVVSSSSTPARTPTESELPQSVVSMEVDHEYEHYELTHQGMIEEV